MNNSEKYRHECEVRHIASWSPNNVKIKEHLALIASKRGKDAAERLREDVWKEIKKPR